MTDFSPSAVQSGIARVRARAALLQLQQAVALLPLEEQLRLSSMSITELQKEFRGVQRPTDGNVIDIAARYDSETKR